MLKDMFGFQSFRPGQLEAAIGVLQEKDTGLVITSHLRLMPPLHMLLVVDYWQLQVTTACPITRLQATMWKTRFPYVA